nr:MAG TPA: hypothetical protein [Caudoviricetes sp.]
MAGGRLFFYVLVLEYFIHNEQAEQQNYVLH